MSLPTHYTGPGLVDLQVNGYAGIDFNSDPGIWTVTNLRRVQTFLARRGVSCVLPTIITDDLERMIARAWAYRRALEDEPALEQTFPALHIEGPYISPEEGPRGAHPSRFCTTPLQASGFVERMREATDDRIRMVTLAPEVDGAVALIEVLARAGIGVGIAHTAADAQTLRAAVDAGATLSTHLGNGSHQMMPRLDNYVQRQLAEDRLHASFIADGHHMPFSTLQNFVRAKTPERSILITDAIAAADAEPGRYRVGGEEVVVGDDLRVSPPGKDHLAGSALTLDRAVVNACSYCAIPFEEAWSMASTRPAALVGLPVPEEVIVRVSDEGFVAAK